MDPIADFLIRIKNAALSNRKTVVVPYSREKENLANILKKEGFLEKVEILVDKAKKDLVLALVEEKGKVRLLEVRRISKPGRRVYVKAKDIRLLKRGLGEVIISSPLGLIAGHDALKMNVGGEVVCKILNSV